MATMVRIKEETHQRLQQLAKSSRRSLPDVLDEAIKQYEKQRFLADCDAAYTRLREDQEAWQDELDERALWDNTLSDGLEDDEYSKAKPTTSARRSGTRKADAMGTKS